MIDTLYIDIIRNMTLEHACSFHTRKVVIIYVIVTNSLPEAYLMLQLTTHSLPEVYLKLQLTTVLDFEIIIIISTTRKSVSTLVFPSSEMNISFENSSLRHLSETTSVTSLFMVVGLLAVITGLTSAATILKTKDLRTKFYMLYVGVAVDDIIMGIGYVATGIKRDYRYYSGIGDVQSRWNCCWESMILYFSQTLGLYMALTLAVDRMFSTVSPLRYKNMKHQNLTYPLIGCAWSLSIFETMYMMFQGHKEKEVILISCGTASCWTPFSYRITLYAHLGVSCLVIATNLLLITLIRYLLKKARQHKSNGWLVQAKKNLQVKVVKTLTTVIISHSTSHISTRLGLLVLWYISDQEPELTVVGVVLRNLVVFNAASHFFIYYATSSEFRDGITKSLISPLKKYLTWSTSVHPSQGHNN